MYVLRVFFPRVGASLMVWVCLYVTFPLKQFMWRKLWMNARMNENYLTYQSIRFDHVNWICIATCTVGPMVFVLNKNLSMCMSVLCMRSGCMFCAAYRAWAFSYICVVRQIQWQLNYMLMLRNEKDKVFVKNFLFTHFYRESSIQSFVTPTS